MQIKLSDEMLNTLIEAVDEAMNSVSADLDEPDEEITQEAEKRWARYNDAAAMLDEFRQLRLGPPLTPEEVHELELTGQHLILTEVKPNDLMAEELNLSTGRKIRIRHYDSGISQYQVIAA